MFGWLRRPRPIAAIKNENIVVNITPGCVVRPGDVVIIPTSEMMMFDLDSGAREELHASVRRLLPVGAKPIFVPMREPLTPANLTWLLEELVGHLRGDRADNAADHSGPEPFRKGDATEAAPHESANLAQGPSTRGGGKHGVDVDAAAVLSPDPSPSLSNPHPGASL